VRLEPFDGFDPHSFTADASPAETERSLDLLVAHNRRSAKTHSGIWRDLFVRGRPTEVDAQLGPIVRCGERLGVATPLNERLIAMIHELEAGKRAAAIENLDRLRTLLA
jgi:2-dehydropantoate 2-reductase